MNIEHRTETSRAPSTGIRIGHIHLHVADLERSVKYYRDVIGFDVVRQMDVAAFLSSDGYHHHVALNTWGTLGMKPDGIRRPGLYHFALNFATEGDLAHVAGRVLDAGYSASAVDHHTHLAIYTADPDGNGIELAWDREPSFWSEFMDPELSIEAFMSVNKKLDLKHFIAQFQPVPA